MGLSHDTAFELSLQACRVLDGAFRRWREGKPTAEVALLNHVSGSFRRADCGFTPLFSRGKGRVRATVYDLHQKGATVGQKVATDAYGSDLAVQVRVERTRSGKVMPERSFSKTAFVQLKKATGRSRKVVLEERQLRAAMGGMPEDPEVRDRAFVAAAYESGGFPTMKPASEALQEFTTDPKKRGKVKGSFDTQDGSWDHIFGWLYGWLQCGEAPYDSPYVVTLLNGLYGVETPSYLHEGRDAPPELLREWLPPSLALVVVIRFPAEEGLLDDRADS